MNPSSILFDPQRIGGRRTLCLSRKSGEGSGSGVQSLDGEASRAGSWAPIKHELAWLGAGKAFTSRACACYRDASSNNWLPAMHYALRSGTSSPFWAGSPFLHSVPRLIGSDSCLRSGPTDRPARYRNSWHALRTRRRVEIAPLTAQVCKLNRFSNHAHTICLPDSSRRWEVWDTTM